MKPTEVLKAEHRVIEQVLASLQAMAEKAENDGTLDARDAEDAVSFFRGFADKCHHGKEEAQLFPAMEARGMPKAGGPTDVMRREHENGRALVRAMAEAIPAASSGDREALARFIENAYDYVRFLSGHIAKEDSVLFAIADQMLGQEDQEMLEREFERVERDEMGEGEHERLHKIADELARKYGVSRAHEHGH